MHQGKTYRLINGITIILTILFLTSCSSNTFFQEGETVVSLQEEKNENELPKKTLQINDDHHDVLQLKKCLQSIGYSFSNKSTKFDEELKLTLKDFQAQVVELPAHGKYDEKTKNWLEKALDKKINISPNEGLLEKNISIYNDEIIVVNNPNDVLVLTNKFHRLPENFEPKDLTVPKVAFPFTEDLPKRYIRKEAAKALEKLFKAAKKEDIILFAQSGYRSYERQDEVFKGHTARLGKKEASKVSALPGHSEHQTGLAMDITAKSVDLQLVKKFGKTKEGKWVEDHAHKFGFIIRYEKGKEHITGYDYEPWHLRYVGKEVAKVIYENDLTLEEYLGVEF